MSDGRPVRKSSPCPPITEHELSRDAPDALKIGQLYVLESHRGKGLGRFILGYVERRARDLGRHALVLQVNKGNTAATAFYQRADENRVAIHSMAYTQV